MSNLIHSRFEVQRPWWYRTLRAIGGFCYRYWWLVWLIFLTYLLCWYLFCYRNSPECCQGEMILQQGINRLNNSLDSCCNCKPVQAQQPPMPPNTKPCDTDEAMQGGKGRTERNHNLGDQAGTVTINYDMVNIPDKIEVYYDGQLVAGTSGYVSNSGSISFYYPADPTKPKYCKVILTAPNDGTAWSYHIGCPR